MGHRDPQSPLADHIPLKQGLRPDPLRFCNLSNAITRRPYSIKTRIKTAILLPIIIGSLSARRPYSIKTRIKTSSPNTRLSRTTPRRPYSIKTRIKTWQVNCHYHALRLPARRPYSIKTRIKTHLSRASSMLPSYRLADHIPLKQGLRPSRCLAPQLPEERLADHIPLKQGFISGDLTRPTCPGNPSII